MLSDAGMLVKYWYFRLISKHYILIDLCMGQLDEKQMQLLGKKHLQLQYLCGLTVCNEDLNSIV